jgi:hypothetical protein
MPLRNRHTGLESPVNPQTRMSALRRCVLARVPSKSHIFHVSDDSPETVRRRLTSGFHSRNVLPHLKREGGSYFVTFRLANTLPREVLLRLKEERTIIMAQALAAKRPLTWHEQDELFRWYSSRVDKFLDAGHGDCWLARPEITEIIAKTFSSMRTSVLIYTRGP